MGHVRATENGKSQYFNVKIYLLIIISEYFYSYFNNVQKLSIKGQAKNSAGQVFTFSIYFPIKCSVLGDNIWWFTEIKANIRKRKHPVVIFK